MRLIVVFGKRLNFERVGSLKSRNLRVRSL